MQFSIKNASHYTLLKVCENIAAPQMRYFHENARAHREHNPVPPTLVGVDYMALAERDRAVSWLRQHENEPHISMYFDTWEDDELRDVIIFALEDDLDRAGRHMWRWDDEAGRFKFRYIPNNMIPE